MFAVAANGIGKSRENQEDIRNLLDHFQTVRKLQKVPMAINNCQKMNKF